MTYIVYLVMLLSVDPAPTFILVGDFSTMGKCQDKVKELVSKHHLDRSKLACMPVITSPMGEPL